MKLFTARFGEIEIDRKDIISFPEGILGFENVKEYCIFNMEEGNPLMWMQSIDEPSLAFVIISPFSFTKNYSLELSDSDTEFLKLTKQEESQIFSIVVVPEDPRKMTANLQGPIIINTVEKIGKQVISTNPRHKTKHYILEEMNELQEMQQGGGE